MGTLAYQKAFRKQLKTSYKGLDKNQLRYIKAKEKLAHCKAIINLCKQHIEKYQKELEKESKTPNGWKLLIEHEQKELEALTKFASILS